MVIDPVLLIGAFVLGTMFGSFLNVCILRLPADQSILRPRSRCPGCETPVAWYDNVPVVSWIVLRAACRHCRQPISVQYPLVELGVGLVWVAALGYYGLTIIALEAAIFVTILLGIAMTDARTMLIPDEFTWGGLAIGVLLSMAGGWGEVMDALLGAAVGFGLLYLVAWGGEVAFKKEAMGGGDIKMMAMVGAFVGWQGVLLTIFGGALLGTLIFIPLSMGRENRLVPFGVFLAGAAALTFVLGDGIWAWYVGTMR